ncbi:immediate early response gene 5-like protein [Mugil cephalus]|uniref:immediate early response gene 5-like protein n=1 Tax=Mugil cephalus TaxID=48193 RepID=UPI001FB79E4A|nr:immediate early response gene 5-like protein [Mugil cephalus]
MISTMECAVDTQSLISISLIKIHNSRTQRGGIKLHKNLLVSYVLRNARQVYIKEKYAEIYRMQHYEEVMRVCNEIQELDTSDFNAEDRGDEEQARVACCGEQTSVCVSSCYRGAAGPTAHCRATSASPGCSPFEEGSKQLENTFCRSCCMDDSLVPHCSQFPGNSNTHCSTTTVLDLDTHVVTTVENGYLHQNCGCDARQLRCGAKSPAKKLKVEFGCCASDADEAPNVTASLKRAKHEDWPFPNTDYMDTSNIFNLISIFGSGFSGLLNRQADLEKICRKQALASLSAWTRAIEAF